MKIDNLSVFTKSKMKTRNCKNAKFYISFEKRYISIRENKHEILIPFENIQSIEYDIIEE